MSKPLPLVVVLDRSLVIRKVLEVYLQRAGLRVVTYATVKDALQAIFLDTSSAPALFILELESQPIDGLHIIQFVRKKNAKIPILALTQRNSILDRVKARIAGANVLLAKPFKTQEILDNVRQLLAQTPP
jgi:DNA-binding response OmpR family regulator